jgi:catechol 2,3-dioxygenase-like lactoylglutathione lyase family enzyme
MQTKIDVITIAVPDLDGARRFYEQGLRATVRDDQGALSVRLGGNASELALRPWESAAADAGVPGHSSGFRGFTLSYIVDSADEVDAVLERAQRYGGNVSKPPKNAVWGYSAYVTDPSGCLWKVASSKRRPLLGRAETAARNGRPVEPREVPITIGVTDMKRAKEFYRDGLGLPVKKDYRRFVMFGGQTGASDLGMYKRDALAGDAAVDPAGSGFRGFSLTHRVDSAERVDALLARAAEAGGAIVKAANGVRGGGYGGYFADPDGNLWRASI